MPLQAAIIGTNFLGGLLLARGLAPEDRGAVAIASITLGLSTILAGAGLAELSLVYAYIPALKSRVTRYAGLWAVGISLVSCAILIVTRTAETFGALCIGSTVVFSVVNLHFLSHVQLRRGVTSVVRTKSYYALLSAGSVAIFWATVGLTRNHVFMSWLIAESLTALGLLCLLRKTPGHASESPPAKMVRHSLGYTLAQTSGMFVDRAITLVAASAGGLGSAGAITVFQNVAAPITAPVQAFSTAILNGKEDARAEKSAIVRLVLALAATAAIVGASLLPFVAGSMWGENYDFIGRYSWIVCTSGFLFATWRVQQIQLRALRRPNLVLISDVAGLGVASSYAWMWGLTKGLDICLLGLTFAGTGCIISAIVQRLVRRRSKDVDLRSQESSLEEDQLTTR